MFLILKKCWVNFSHWSKCFCNTWFNQTQLTVPVFEWKSVAKADCISTSILNYNVSMGKVCMWCWIYIINKGSFQGMQQYYMMHNGLFFTKERKTSYWEKLTQLMTLDDFTMLLSVMSLLCTYLKLRENAILYDFKCK